MDCIDTVFLLFGVSKVIIKEILSPPFQIPYTVEAIYNVAIYLRIK